MDIQAKTDQLNALFLEVRAYKCEHPETRAGFYTSNYGSLLNAYREGDLGFDECIEYLKVAHIDNAKIEQMKEEFFARLDSRSATFASKLSGAEQGNWQPVSNAPKDRTCILLLSAAYEDEIQGEIFTYPPKIAIGYWNPEGSSWVPDGPPHEEDSSCTLAVTGVWNSGGGWFQPDEVTHWQPLPLPPARDAVAQASGEEEKQ